MVISAVATQGSHAQDALVRAAYGKGVHAFYAGQLLEAERFLSEAIQAGSRDPRCFYFRGLAMLRTGQSAAAEGDFRMAAALEVQHAGVFDVGQALARVQGADRLKLEEIRRETKLAMQPQKPATGETEGTAATTPPIRPRTPGVQFEVTDFSQLPEDPTDPFAGDTNDALTHDITPVEAPPAATAGSGSDVVSESSGDEDFGSDVDNLFSAGEDSPDSANPFLDESGNASAGTASAPGSSGATGATTGALKSVFRSFLNMAPSVPSPPSMPIPGMPGSGFPGGPGPGDFPGGDVPPDGFGPPGTDSSGADFGFPDESDPNGPTGTDPESDPFGNPDDPFGTPDTETNSGNTGFDENPFPDAAE
jgi:hypothetical protein